MLDNQHRSATRLQHGAPMGLHMPRPTTEVDLSLILQSRQDPWICGIVAVLRENEIVRNIDATVERRAIRSIHEKENVPVAVGSLATFVALQHVAGRESRVQVAI